MKQLSKHTLLTTRQQKRFTLTEIWSLHNSTDMLCPKDMLYSHTKLCLMNNQTVFSSSRSRCQVISVSASAWLRNQKTSEKLLITEELVIIQWDN